MLKYKPDKIFIGLDINSHHQFGRSILLKMSRNKYIHIGCGVWSFESYYNIVVFSSSVSCNGSIVESYAIDDHGIYYLFMMRGLVLLSITG